MKAQNRIIIQQLLVILLLLLQLTSSKQFQSKNLLNIAVLGINNLNQVQSEVPLSLVSFLNFQSADPIYLIPPSLNKELMDKIMLNTDLLIIPELFNDESFTNMNCIKKLKIQERIFGVLQSIQSKLDIKQRVPLLVFLGNSNNFYLKYLSKKTKDKIGIGLKRINYMKNIEKSKSIQKKRSYLSSYRDIKVGIQSILQLSQVHQDSQSSSLNQRVGQSMSNKLKSIDFLNKLIFYNAFVGIKKHQYAILRKVAKNHKSLNQELNVLIYSREHETQSQISQINDNKDSNQQSKDKSKDLFSDNFASSSSSSSSSNSQASSSPTKQTERKKLPQSEEDQDLTQDDDEEDNSKSQTKSKKPLSYKVPLIYLHRKAPVLGLNFKIEASFFPLLFPFEIPEEQPLYRITRPLLNDLFQGIYQELRNGRAFSERQSSAKELYNLPEIMPSHDMQPKMVPYHRIGLAYILFHYH